MKKIVCFGDSNTYGYNPANGGRFDENTRWPKRLQELLGDEYEIIEEGQNGRNISDPDPWEGGTKCGMDYVLPMIETKHPLDLLVIMLGTNDLKLKFHLPAADIAGSMQLMITNIRAYCRDYLDMPDLKILLVSPPALSEPFSESCFAPFFGDSKTVEKSKELAKWYELVAQSRNCYFLNATASVSAGDVDHLHLDEKGHDALAKLVFEKIKEIL